MEAPSVRILLVGLLGDEFNPLARLVQENAGGPVVVTPAPTFAAGLSRVAEGGFQLIIINWTLEGGSGLDWVAQAFGTVRSAPFILLADAEDEDLEELAHQSGAAGFLVKSNRDAAIWRRAMRCALTQAQTERALRESDARYRSLFETNPQPIWIYDAVTMEVLAVNQAVLEHYGYEAAACLAMTIGQVSAPPNSPPLSEELASLALGPSHAPLLRHTRADGSFIDVLVRGDDLIFEGRRARLVVVNDVTERVTAARRESELREFLQSTLDSLASHVAVLDDKGVILAVNRAWLDFGQENGMVAGFGGVGSSYVEACESHPAADGSGRAIAHALRQMLEGRRSRYSLVYSCPDHPEHPWFQIVATRFQARGRLHVVVSHHNITEQKRAEEERDRFFSISLDLLCVTDTRGYFQRINPAFSTTLGYAPGELLFRPLVELVHADDLEGTLAAIEAMRLGETSAHFVNRCLCNDGSYKWLAWTCAVHEGLAYSVARDISDLKLAEGKLERSLSLLQATLDATAEGILVLDEAGQIADHNRKFVTMWGLPGQLLQSEDDGAILAHMRNQLERPEALFSNPFPTPEEGQAKGFDILRFRDGRSLERYSQPQLLGGLVVGRVWSFRDISERKWAEAMQVRLTHELESERQRLKDTLANLPGIVWESWLPAGDEGELPRTGYVSDYVTQLLGYSTRDWLSSPGFWLTLIHPEDLAATFAQQAALAEENATGGVYRYRMRSADGHYVWVETHTALIRDSKGDVLGLRGVSMDISDRMHAQEAQERLVALLEATTDYVGWAEAGGKARYLNRAGRMMLDMGLADDLTDVDITSLARGAQADQSRRQDLSVAREQGVWSGEAVLRGPRGTELPVSQVIIAHRDATGEVQFYSTIARDISDRLSAEAALREAKNELEERVIARTAQLQRANREYLLAKEEADAANNAKSEFLSRMSHELRTPLNAILGFGQILEMRALGRRDLEAVEQILVAGRHLLELINEVLDIARIESGRLALSPEAIPVTSVLKGALEMVRPLTLPRQIELVDAIESKGEVSSSRAWTIFADRQRLHQVLLNLLSNAIKYNRVGGEVILSCQELPAPLPGESALLRINVSDTGPGLRQEDVAKLFLPFERLGAENTTVEGTGIGLVLAKRLTEAMGGRLGVDSVVGEGSVFWVELPLMRQTVLRMPSGEETLVLHESQRGDGHWRKNVSMLYVEDNMANLALVEAFLKELGGVKLHTATRGETGLKMARELKPDFVLLDLQLPDMLGEEVLRALLADPATAAIPVVAISADSTPRQVERLMAAGAKKFLTKPLNIAEFLQVMNLLLAEENFDAGQAIP